MKLPCPKKEFVLYGKSFTESVNVTIGSYSIMLIKRIKLSLQLLIRFMDTIMEGITASERAQQKAIELMTQAGINNDPSYFLRVSVVGGGCSGLSYKLDFDNELKENDQVFEMENLKLVTDIKSLLYLLSTELDYSDGLNGKGFVFKNPNASRTCGCGESFAV